MRAGKLTRRIRLESRVETDDAAGEPIATWVLFAELWASIEPLQGREFVTAQQEHSNVTGKIRIRYTPAPATGWPGVPGVNAKMRAVELPYQKVYDIVAVMDLDTRHREMQLLYSEGLNDG